MKTTSNSMIALVVWCFGLGVLACQPVWADPVGDRLPRIVYGGKLYDNWLVYMPAAQREELKKSQPTHPSYPKSGQKKGMVTWRCKECHGWDYRGDQGAFSTGSHATGIRGIQRWVGQDPRKVVAVIRDGQHGIDESMMSPEDAEALAEFVVAGQFDSTPYLEPGTHKALGKPEQGAPFFQTICAACHGLDGRWINFDAKGGVEYLGHVARENPWEVLHKIRNGQPGRSMVSSGALTIQQQIDILSYAQTLPLEKIDHSTPRAGYDPAIVDDESWQLRHAEK